MEQEKKTAGMPCPPCKSAPFSRAVKPAAQENAVQEPPHRLVRPVSTGLRRRPDRKDARLHRSGTRRLPVVSWPWAGCSGSFSSGAAGGGSAMRARAPLCSRHFLRARYWLMCILQSCARPGKAGSGWRYCFAWGLAMHCPTAADCWEPSITARCCSQRDTGR